MPRNCRKLQVAWQWKHWETPLKEYGTTPGQFESTPLMVDGTLYVTTPYNSLAALDAETGAEKWRFDGHAYELGQLLSGSGWKLRGTADVARRWSAPHLPEQPPSTRAARRGDREAGCWVRQQRRRLTD